MVKSYSTVAPEIKRYSRNEPKENLFKSESYIVESRSEVPEVVKRSSKIEQPKENIVKTEVVKSRSEAIDLNKNKDTPKEEKSTFNYRFNRNKNRSNKTDEDLPQPKKDEKEIVKPEIVKKKNF